MPRKVFGFVAVLPSLRLVFFALSCRVVVVAGVVKSVAAGSVVPMLVDPGRNAGLCAAGMVVRGGVVSRSATGAVVVLRAACAAAVRALPIPC